MRIISWPVSAGVLITLVGLTATSGCGQTGAIFATHDVQTPSYSLLGGRPGGQVLPPPPPPPVVLPPVVVVPPPPPVVPPPVVAPPPPAVPPAVRAGGGRPIAVIPPPAIAPPPPVPGAALAAPNLLPAPAPFVLARTLPPAVKFLPTSATTGRLRLELQGDVVSATQPTLESLWALATGVPPTTFLNGSSTVVFSNTGTSAFAGTNVISNLAMPIPVLEPFLVFGTSASGDVSEVIWPNHSPGAIPGPVILRTELASWDPRVGHGVNLDMAMNVKQTSATGVVLAQYITTATKIRVP
jgi:hypothetical protein